MKFNKVFTTILLLFAFVFVNLITMKNVANSAGLQVSDMGMHYRASKGSVVGYVRPNVTFIKGDLDNNGSVDNADVTLLKNYLVDSSTVINKSNADLNNDGKVSVTDLSQLTLKISKGKDSNFKVVYPANGLYSLQPMCAPQKELTVKDASTANNANVFIYSIASNVHKHPSHQKWKIERINGTEWYKITAENSGKALNVHNGIAMNGTNVDIYPYGGRMHQFRFIDTGNGYYAIQANVGDTNKYNYVLDVENAVNANGTNVSIHQFTVHPAQRWRLVRRPAAIIKAVKERKVLKGDVDGNGKVEQVDLTLLTKYLLDKTIKINAANADVNGDGRITGTDASQLMSKFPQEKTVTLKDGWYRIRCGNLYALYSSSSPADNQSIVLNAVNENVSIGDNYQFYLENQGNGYFTLREGYRGKYVSVLNSGISNTTSVVTKLKDNSSAQLWRLLEAGNGYCYVETSLKKRLAFACANGKVASSTRIQLWDIEKAPYNKNIWSFELVDSDKVLKGDVDGNGKVEQADLTLLTKYISDKNISVLRLARADMNGDGEITTIDVSQLRLKLPKENTPKVINVTDGWYKISSVNALNKSLDVSNSGSIDGSNIILYQYADTSNQKFYLENKGNGYFTLKAGHCDMYVSAANSSGANNTNIQINSKNNNSTQLWRLIDAGNSCYYIESRLKEGLSLDCANGGSVDGTNIQLWNRGNVAWNKWKLEKVTAPRTVMPTGRVVNLVNGWYKIISANNLNNGLDVSSSGTSENSNIILYQYADTNNQKFYLENKGSGWFTLKAGHCDMYVSAASSSGANNTNIQINSKNNNSTQLWRLIDAGNGCYYIESRLQAGLSFDCANGSSANGTNIQLWARGNVAWNKWKFSRVAEPSPNYKFAYPQNGLYSIQPMCAPQKELTVQNASTANNANVIIYDAASVGHKHPSHQKWYVTRLGNTEWYKITAENSGKALNVHNGYAANGTNVDIYPYGAKMHQFRFYDAGNGYYLIQGNMDGAYVLDVSGGVNNNGANVQIWSFNGGSSQKWKLVSRPVATETAVPVSNSEYIWPIPKNYKVTTLYYYYNYYKLRNGVRDYKHACRYGHFNGIDISATVGTTIRAVAAGKIVECVNDWTSGVGFGNYLVIEHKNGTKSLYAHLNKVFVTSGNVVANQIIAESGETGNVGPHLHFEFSDLNPWEVYRSDVPLKYCKTTLSAYSDRCSAIDKEKFKETVDWIKKYGGGFTI